MTSYSTITSVHEPSRPASDAAPAARTERGAPRYVPPRFDPHPLIRGGHLQTILGAYAFRPQETYRASPRLVDLPEGERLVLHDDCPAGWQPGDRAALLLHGLGGCHQSPYMVRFAAKLNAYGIRSFRMDMRGHGAGLRHAASPGHAGRSEDAAAAIDLIAQLCPGSPLAIVGISLGGNILLKYLGERGAAAHPQVDRCLAVAPPIDLVHCSRLIQRLRSRLYDWKFVRELLQQVRDRREHWPSLATLDLRRPPRTLWEFDERVTAPLSGYASAAEYYANSSSGPLLSRIEVPTTIITAADDPLVPPDVFERASLSSSIAVHVTRSGGHIGFIGAKGRDPDRRWLDWRVIEWATHDERAS